MKINKIKLSILAIMSLTFVGCGSSGGGHDHSANISQQAKDLLNANTPHSVRNEQAADIETHANTLNTLYSADNDKVIDNKNIVNGFNITSNKSLNDDITQQDNTKKVGAFLSNHAVVSTNKNVLVHGTDGFGAIVSDGSSLTVGEASHSEINIDGTKAIGFVSEDKGSSVSLGANSKVNMHSQHGIVLAAVDGGRVENRGTIELQGDHNIGLLADGKDSRAVNHGTINVKGQKDTAMMATNGGTIENANDGNIQISDWSNHDGNNSFAKDSNKNSKVINHGHVVIRHSENDWK